MLNKQKKSVLKVIISTQKRCLQFDVYFILFRKKDEFD